MIDNSIAETMKPQLEEQQRFHHLDAVRASALLLGILLHSIISYMPGYREANWPLSDDSTSVGLGILYFVIHLFRMSVFFLIAGFFARLLHQRLGTGGLIRNRLRRIALPMIAFYLLAMPLTVVAIVWGARQLGIKGMAKMEYPMPIVGPPVPWGHLWFLYMLLLIYVLVLLLRSAVVRIDAGGALRSAVGRSLDWSLRWRLAPLLLAAPIAISLNSATWWVQWQGIPSPIAGLLPNLSSLLAYGGAFLVGWYLHRRQESLSALAADWPLYLAGAVAGTAVALYIVGVVPRLAVIPLGSLERALYAVAFLVAQWCATFCAIGIALRYLAAPSARWRYLADASFWMYLVHLPVIMLLQAWMLKWQLHWTIKLFLILAITTVLLLSSYHFLVRRTFMGVFLNGRKYSQSADSDAPSSKPAAPVAGAS